MIPPLQSKLEPVLRLGALSVTHLTLYRLCFLLSSFVLSFCLVKEETMGPRKRRRLVFVCPSSSLDGGVVPFFVPFSFPLS